MKTFTHNFLKLDLPELTSSTLDDGSRFYKSPSGQWLPSVTTVVNHEKKEFFKAWRLDPNNQAKGLRAQNRGTQIHGIAERYVLNMLDPSTEHPEAMKLFETGFRQELDKHVDNVRASETTLWSDLLGLAGRVDLIADYRKKRSVIDFKGATQPLREEWIETYFMQISTYAVMWEERTGETIEQVVIIAAVEDPQITQVFVKEPGNYLDRILEVKAKYLADTVKSIQQQQKEVK